MVIGALNGLRLFLAEPEQEVVIQDIPRETAVISCDQPVRQFGTIQAKDGPIEHTFVVGNSGKAPLVIVNCDGACGCITAEWSKEPIAPGATGFVKVTYNPEGVSGIFMKNIQVLSNASNESFLLTVRGQVE